MISLGKWAPLKLTAIIALLLFRPRGTGRDPTNIASNENLRQIRSASPLRLPALSPSMVSGVGYTRKEVFGGLAFHQTIDETVPVGDPMESCSRDNRCPTVFHGAHRRHGMIPLQCTPQSMPEVGIEEGCFHGDNEGGRIIFPDPHGVFAIGSSIVGIHPVRPV